MKSYAFQALSIISNRNLFKNIDKKSKYELQKVKAPSGLQLKSIANAISMNFEELKSINKHIKKQVVPSDSKNYNIYIPNTKLDVYNQKMGNITVVKDNINVSKVVETKKNNKINKEKPLIYIIKKGDSLESIAKKHKVSIKKLKIVNNKKSNLLKIGDKIEIYK